MIPLKITKDHIRQAAQQIDDEGVPKGREARKYHVIVNGKYYPLKYIVSKAKEYANGEELSPYAFTAPQALRFLKKLDFKIIPIEFGRMTWE